MALIAYVSRIQFDHGAIALVPDELALIGVTAPLVVTDPGVVRAGLLDRLWTSLGGQRPVYAETPSNPTEAAALEALAIYRQAGCDGVVALGGGSASDLAKAVALLATHAGSLGDYLVGAGSERIGPVAPVLAIPTTAGTGAEIGRAATLTLLDGRKAACVSPHLIPICAVCDPDLTASLPPFLTAATGMDAFAHGVEAFFSPAFNPPADAIALDCASRAWTWLPRAVADGGDRQARWQMLMAAIEGGMVFQKGLGAVHAASHPLGAHGFHHGLLNAILLPPVLRLNAGIAPARADTLAARLGLARGIDLPEAVTALITRLGLPTRLSAIGVTPGQIAEAAAHAPGEHLNKTNPRPLVESEFRDVLESVF